MIRDYHALRPFRFWCQKVLPLVYDDSLSYYELLCKVVDYLNKTREDLAYFITNWSTPIPVTDYNDFTDTSKIYLYMGDQTGYNKGHWYFYNPNTGAWEDGGLYGGTDITDEQVNQILSKLPPEIGYNLRKIDRQFIINDGVNPYNMHGGCAISDNEVVYALLDYDYLENNVAHIYSHNIQNHTWTEKTQLVIGHCDSMAYDPNSGKLYIAPAYQSVNGNEVHHGDIYVYDYATMELLNVITGVNANSVGFDKVNGELYYTTFNNEWKNSNHETLFGFDTSWTSSRQGIFIYDGGFYLVTAFPNNIREFDSEGNIVRNIPIKEQYNFYLVGEVQWADVVGDRLLLGSMIDCEDSSEKYPTTWETNLKTNIQPSHDYGAWHVMTTMHVDVNSASYCPTGSTGQKFKSINEAMLYANMRTTIHEMDLYNGTYKGRINCNMDIRGNGNTILEPTFKSCVARITNCASVINANILDGCFVQSPIEFTPIGGFYYLQKDYQETRVSNDWTFNTTPNFIRGQSVFLKLDMNSGSNVPSSSWTTLITGYPKPRQNWFSTNIDKYGNIYRFRINTNGELAIANLSGNALSIDTTMVYPIG